MDCILRILSRVTALLFKLKLLKNGSDNLVIFLDGACAEHNWRFGRGGAHHSASPPPLMLFGNFMIQLLYRIDTELHIATLRLDKYLINNNLKIVEINIKSTGKKRGMEPLK